MSKKLLSTLIASLFASAPALAQSSDDPMRVEGSATLGAITNNTSAFDTAKLQEYQDLGNGVLSNIDLRGRNSSTWFTGYGENFGRSDQYLYLGGGMYDVFKAGAYLNDIPHTFSSNAYSPYNGNGSNLLTATFPLAPLPAPQPPGNWSNFTLGTERRDAGGFFEWQKNSPWYVRADGSQVSFSGTKVGAAANGTSPGNGYVDLAVPNDLRTTNFGVEGGYQTSKMTLAVRWDYSKFDNANETLRWTNPYFGGNNLDTNYLAPDNTFNKFTLTGNYRDLPWKSVVSARYTWSKTTSEATLAQTALNTGPVYAPTLPEHGSFNGENVNQSFALAWTAAPMANVDSRVYYYWTKQDGKSDIVDYGNAPTQPLATGLGCGNVPGLTPNTWVPGNCENENYNYTKNNLGFDVWWKFLRNQRVGFGWDYTDLDQTRPDYDEASWNKLWVEYKNTMLDTLSARLKYQYIKRDSTLNFTTAGLTPNDPNYLLAYTSSFDLQSSTTNQFKLNLDWNPLPALGLSFEGVWSNQDYDDVTLGRTKSDRQGYFLSGNWGAADKLALNAFGSWEQTKYPSNHRYIGTVANGPTPPPGFCTPANPNCFSPFAPPFQASAGSTTASYNWNSQTKDETWMLGVGADWQAMDALKLTASYLYVNNDGNATFGVQPGPVLNPPALAIDNFDSSTQQYFNLKGIWNYTRNWSFTGGYSYIKYSHDDIATNGYQYVLPYAGAVASNTSLSYLNGVRRVHRRPLEHLLRDGDVQVRRPAAARCAAEGRRGAEASAGAGGRAAAPAGSRAGTGPRAGAAGAEDHAGLEGAVRLRQGGAEARGQGGDRQPGGGQAEGRAEARGGAGDRPHRPHRHRGLQPEAVRAPCRCGARLPGEQGRRQGKDRDPRHGREAAGGAVRPEEPEGPDRLPGAEPPRRSAGQGRGDQALNRRNRSNGPRRNAGPFFRCATRSGMPRWDIASPARACGGRSGCVV